MADSIGLPVEGIGIMIALDTIPDMFKTLLNVTADMTVAVMTSASGKIDADGLTTLSAKRPSAIG